MLSSDLKYGPCPPARDFGSRVSGLVFLEEISQQIYFSVFVDLNDSLMRLFFVFLMALSWGSTLLFQLMTGSLNNYLYHLFYFFFLFLTKFSESFRLVDKLK